MKTIKDRLYEKYNSYSRRPTALEHAIRDKQFKSFNRILGRWLPDNRAISVLDVGCGEGTLLSFLQQRNYTNLYGFDLSLENVNICHQLGFSFVEKFDALEISNFSPEIRFDLIFLMDIIEHISKNEIVEFLENVLKRIKPGGAIIIQTPNMGSLYASHILHNDLSHEFGLTEKTAMDLMMMIGFNTQEVYIGPAWNATTLLGYIREIYLRILHFIVYIGTDAARPEIPTKDLLIRAVIN